MTHFVLYCLIFFWLEMDSFVTRWSIWIPSMNLRPSALIAGWSSKRTDFCGCNIRSVWRGVLQFFHRCTDDYCDVDASSCVGGWRGVMPYCLFGFPTRGDLREVLWTVCSHDRGAYSWKSYDKCLVAGGLSREITAGNPFLLWNSELQTLLKRTTLMPWEIPWTWFPSVAGVAAGGRAVGCRHG